MLGEQSGMVGRNEHSVADAPGLGDPSRRARAWAIQKEQMTKAASGFPKSSSRT